MRLRKYYDVFRTNKPFLKTSLVQRIKISMNILKFFFADKKLIIANKPVTAQIEPTSCCNLRCEMCVREKIGVPIGTLSFEDFKKILDKLDCLFKIHLSGQGEPFMNKNLFKMIKYANKRGILVNLNTNGTLLTKKNIDNLCRVEVGEVAISMESTNKKEYEKIRKGAKFEEVIKNIVNLCFNLKRKKKNTIVSLAITILKKNIAEIPEFVKIAENCGVEKLIIQTLQEKEDYVSKYGKDTKSQRTSNFNKKVEEEIKKTKNLAQKKNITLIFDEEKSEGCIWPWRGIYISWNGFITPCCKILNYNKPLIGNILKEDFWKIWNGKHYQMFRRMLKQRKAPLPCKGCKEV